MWVPLSPVVPVLPASGSQEHDQGGHSNTLPAQLQRLRSITSLVLTSPQDSRRENRLHLLKEECQGHLVRRTCEMGGISVDSFGKRNLLQARTEASPQLLLLW